MATQVWSWLARLILAGLAIGGTWLYVSSFGLGGEVGGGSTIALNIGVAAGLSWVFFGLVLLLVVEGRPSALSWADVCLKTMAVGISLLIPAIVLNSNLDSFRRLHNAGLWLDLLRWYSPLIHLFILLAANLHMGIYFVLAGTRLFGQPRKLMSLWLLALNGMFVLLMSLISSGSDLP